MRKGGIWDFWAKYGQSEHAFMQNKPNFQKAQMNVTSTQLTSYLLPFTNYQHAKQTQSKPISQRPRMSATFFSTKPYQNNPLRADIPILNEISVNGSSSYRVLAEIYSDA
jgi:hypothetical protein